MKKLNITLEGRATYRGKIVRVIPIGLPRFINEYELKNIREEFITSDFPESANAYTIAKEKATTERWCGHAGHASQIEYLYPIQFYKTLGGRKNDRKTNRR